jgi:hypothetical protein
MESLTSPRLGTLGLLTIIFDKSEKPGELPGLAGENGENHVKVAHFLPRREHASLLNCQLEPKIDEASTIFTPFLLSKAAA